VVKLAAWLVFLLEFLVADLSALRLAFLFLGLRARFDLDRHGLCPLRHVDYDFIYSLYHGDSSRLIALISADSLSLYIFV